MNLREIVNKLLEQAANAKDPNEALKFSQAALNSAHTHHALSDNSPKK